MVKERDEQSGRYTATVDDAEIVAFVRDQGGAGTSDVAERFDYERPSAYRRLKDLESAGRVAGREVGNSILWLATDADQSPPASARESATEGAGVSGEESAADGSTPQPPGDGESRSERAHGGESDTFDRDRWRDRLTETVPRSGAVAERRADAILKMYDHLREHGEAENDTLAELVDPDAVEYKNAGSIWSNLVKGKETLRALPGVEPPPPSVDEPWRYPPAIDDGGRRRRGGE